MDWLCMQNFSGERYNVYSVTSLNETNILTKRPNTVTEIFLWLYWLIIFVSLNIECIS